MENLKYFPGGVQQSIHEKRSGKELATLARKEKKRLLDFRREAIKADTKVSANKSPRRRGTEMGKRQLVVGHLCSFGHLGSVQLYHLAVTEAVCVGVGGGQGGGQCAGHRGDVVLVVLVVRLGGPF